MSNTQEFHSEELYDKFVNLETMITYQDSQIERLTSDYKEQQKQLFKIEKELSVLKDIIRSLQSSNLKNQSDETPPPHY